MSDRIPCRTPGCEHRILLSTAERNDGFCMPCVQAAARKAHDEHVRLNRRDVDAFAGVSDPVEVLKIMHLPRVTDPLINPVPYPEPAESLYVRLDMEGQRRLAEHAEALLGTAHHDDAEDIVLCLAAFTDAPLDSCLRALVAEGDAWPSLPFRRASPGLRDDLIALLDRDGVNRDHLLLALAWIGDAVVVDLFQGWRAQPPAWAGTLYLAPQDYAREAGWELDEDDRRRPLYFDACTQLVPGASDRSTGFMAVTDRDDTCPCCSRRLTNLFELDPSAFGLGDWAGAGRMLQVATCEVCTAFGTVWGAFDEQGRWRWHAANPMPGHPPGDAQDWAWLPRNPLVPAAKRTPWFAADDFLPTTFSQVGGQPTWVQDASHPVCPDCSKTMRFLAQLDHADIEAHSEGIFYAFVCMGCRTTATMYQQT